MHVRAVIGVVDVFLFREQLKIDEVIIRAVEFTVTVDFAKTLEVNIVFGFNARDSAHAHKLLLVVLFLLIGMRRAKLKIIKAVFFVSIGCFLALKTN